MESVQLGAAVRDVFNVEQVEVFKGPAGADNGRGATSGYINLASKVPLAEDFSAGSVERRQRRARPRARPTSTASSTWVSKAPPCA